MVKKMNILLISRDENCETEVTDFLLKSQRTFYSSQQCKNNELTIAEYAYRGGPPTVIKGGGRDDDLRVYYVIKCFNTIQTLYKIQYDAIIIFLCDNDAENSLILEYINPNILNVLKECYTLTIIGNITQSQLSKMSYQFNFGFCDRWITNEKYAYSWSTHELRSIYLWTHIKNYYNTTRVSYISEIIVRSIIDLFGFLKNLVGVICSNIRVLASGMETSNIQLFTLIREGDLNKQEYKNVEDLLTLFNISNLGDFDRLLKKEIKQLATYLSQLAILCNEIVNFTGDLHTKLYHNFCGLEEFKDLYYGELPKIVVENITDSVIHSLDAMSKLKFTGRYIKDVLGIEKINELKSCLKRHYSFKNIQIDEVKPNSQPEKGNQDIDIEDRIGNIQLLKSLQKTIQEFTDELKQVRQVQEVVTKDIKEMKKKLNFVCNQLNDESSSTSNMLLMY